MGMMTCDGMLLTLALLCCMTWCMCVCAPVTPNCY